MGRAGEEEVIGARGGVTGELRGIKPGEEEIFARWEAADRPYPWNASHFLLSGEGPGMVLVMEQESDPIGFAVIQVVGDEGYLANLMVNPAYRRRGHGATLLQKVMIVARDHGACRLVLDVDAANGPALSLYRRAGFQTLEQRRRAYPRGEDALVMKKDL